MKEQHIEKARELVEQYGETLLDEIVSLANSGMIDFEGGSPDSYIPAKLLITAAIHRTKDAYSPPAFNKSLVRAVKNLIKA